MKLAVVALTKNGTECADKICKSLKADLYIKERFLEQGFLIEDENNCYLIEEAFSKTVEKLFLIYEGIVFVMAAGIVVRSIAPYLLDKESDPAVVVVDELGRFSISLLSGHIGGANRLASEVAEALDAVPVITTATDINNVTAFDELAALNNCIIENIKDLKYISSELINGGKVGFISDLEVKGELKGNINIGGSQEQCCVVLSNRKIVDVKSEKTLHIRPKNLVLGIGCKKGKSSAELQEAVHDFLDKNNVSILSIKYIASIDIKASEEGILEFSSKMNIPFVTYTSEELNGIGEKFTASEFVKGITGVGNVCEASAYLASNGGKILCHKTIYDGITLALAEEEKIIYYNN